MGTLHSSSPLKIFFDNNPRQAGFWSLLVGGALIYCFVVCPVQDAQAHAAGVHIYMKGTVLGTVLLCFGMLRLAFGARLASLIDAKAGGSRVAGIVLIVFLLGMGFAVHHAVRTFLEAHGYRFY